MTIVIDYSQIAKSGIFVEAAEHFDNKMFKENIIGRIRNILNHHQDRDVIIACDGPGYWRRKEFKHYKAKRSKTRQADDFDWDEIFNAIQDIEDDLRDFFPYKIIKIFSCEADDVIGTIAFQNSAMNKDTIIVSDDSDFYQLHNNYVKQWSPRKQEWLVCEDANNSLFQKIITGDSGDGIPNILSPDDIFLKEDRQSTISKKMKDEAFNFWDGTNLNDEFFASLEANKIWPSLKNKNIPVSDIKRNYERNKKLIDLRETPKELRDKIISNLSAKAKGDLNSVMVYFAKNKMNVFFENVGDFV